MLSLSLFSTILTTRQMKAASSMHQSTHIRSLANDSLLQHSLFNLCWDLLLTTQYISTYHLKRERNILYFADSIDTIIIVTPT